MTNETIVDIKWLKLNRDDYSDYLKIDETVDGTINSISLHELMLRIINNLPEQ